MNAMLRVCHYCGKPLTGNDTVTVDVPSKDSPEPTTYLRNFHYECLGKFLKTRNDQQIQAEQQKDWTELCDYFKYEILKLKPGQTIDKHAVMRLLGLRVGRYAPKGDQVRNINRGYDFKTILYTAKYCKPKIERALATKNFGNESDSRNHMINYIMAIIIANINFIQERRDKVEHEQQRAEKLKAEVVQKPAVPELTRPRRGYKRKGVGRKKYDFVI